MSQEPKYSKIPFRQIKENLYADSLKKTQGVEDSSQMTETKRDKDNWLKHSVKTNQWVLST